MVCEFTAAGRRLEVTRSPAWERPKKRGTGTTLQQARVLVRELRDGDWVPVTGRVDEAADVLSGVLGLGADQFTKLVLLPQGDFAAFLRADAEDRRTLLERLFGTDRFAAVQQWLREAQAARRQEVEAADARTSQLVARAEQASAMVGSGAAVAVLPASGGPSVTADRPGALPPRPDGPESAGVDDPVERLRALRVRVETALDEARRLRVAAQERARHAAADHRAAVETARLQARLADLTRAAERLRALAPEQARREARVAAAQCAAGIARWVRPLEAARTRSGDALQAVDRAMVELARHGTPEDAGLDDDRLLARSQGARQLVGELAAVEVESAEARSLERSVAAARAALARADGDREAAAREVDALAARADRLGTELAEARTVAATMAGARAALELADGAAAAAEQAAALGEHAAALAARRDDLRRARDDAREHWLDLRQRRLAGMASELARDLATGSPCPVCGSPEHPAPAPAAPEAPDDAEERRAESAVAAAQDELAACEGRLASVRARAAAATEAAGAVTPDQAREAAATAERGLREAQEASARASRLEERLRDGAAARDPAHNRLDQASARREDAHTELTRLEERLGLVARRVAAARGDHPSVAARRGHAQRLAAAAEALLVARREVRAATQHLAEVTDAARAAALDAGFDDVEAACGVVLDPGELARLEQASQAYEQERVVVEAGLADPELITAGAAPPAQPAALATAEELAEEADEAAAAALDRCRAAGEALASLEAELDRHVAATEPVRRRHQLWSELSRCLDGTGGDNALRMSLSSYVLAARLEQVAAAASERLLAMSGGRYSLEHCDEAERGRGRSGLSLRVVDGWTGRRRDTASLSGGESFYTSLALALGLADVVTAEAGGATIETLFVDEGFGSLDEETLHEVMDTLDGLRSGGRVVGLVSHVPDLRERIPTRLEVVKTRSGSTVRQASA